MKNKTIFCITSVTKPTTFFESTTTFFESTIRLIVIGQLWKWLKTFPKIVLTIKTLSGCRLWKACKRCLCLGISKSNNSIQRLSSPWTSDLFLCPSYKIFWTLAPSIKKGLSGLRTIVGFFYGPKTITTIIVNLSKPRIAPTPSYISWAKTPLI